MPTYREHAELTTLCYIDDGSRYLMLHRVSKKHDENGGKWIGVGGHFEKGESPEDCLLREVKEETGLELLSWRFRGIVTFVSDDNAPEYMCLYTADSWKGDITPCNEGELEWIEKSAISGLNLWQGDRLFLKLLASEAPFFSLKLVYKNGTLIHAEQDGKPVEA